LTGPSCWQTIQTLILVASSLQTIQDQVSSVFAVRLIVISLLLMIKELFRTSLRAKKRD
jgi:hypothetical protein